MERKITIPLHPGLSKEALNRALKGLNNINIKCDYSESTKDGKQFYILDFMVTPDITETNICEIGMIIALKIIIPY
jgi:hypothetical protein